MRSKRPSVKMASMDNNNADSSNNYEDSSSDDENPLNLDDLNIQAYRFEPQRDTDDENSETDGDTDEESLQDHNIIGNDRVGNVGAWCLCGCCSDMQKEIDCLCCRELVAINGKENNEQIQLDCICNHPKFSTLCLDRDVLGVAAITVSAMMGTFLPVPVTDTFFRLTAYRQFTLWIYGKLGRHNRRVVPACVVNKVRLQFPNLDGRDNFVGFEEAN
ncbi:hypothetical protein MAR_033417 [Mya arenaria]|uniref:P2X purinoreceptor 7 intracellular domain-containing protein n=1 Tax=Mya arenaria TaxID=6604 RepID=A0ABY7G8Z4_MYAAR|nr:P2X purinoceptor 7-like [Mya arenaria]XP_052769648.1 P2X purinoceptor 7-like [Mya arenaria]XP_052788275.1 P2X purinoceptor 7-like [Mya arenaria]XP_052790594.1 P2X purinoceptor 7-like [Mya arenaria]WAR18486.1 hypothetical protein MAR_000324 [Mya arenaria]WAR20602.1 hypothetical protein MAR_002440 [Mya arenaria]WAR30871.1 hypothetical protein MAR_033413 [Mya arenaria]WAR30875.1 hypothetical protein MAR_033417 [Mya arenaria]